MDSVDCLFVLASMTPDGAIASSEELANHHRSLGFFGVAVHYVIDPTGRVTAGRDRSLPGGLAGAFNCRSIQVCLIGGLGSDMRPQDNFTEAQRRSLRQIIDNEGLPVKYADGLTIRGI